MSGCRPFNPKVEIISENPIFISDVTPTVTRKMPINVPNTSIGYLMFTYIALIRIIFYGRTLICTHKTFLLPFRLKF